MLLSGGAADALPVEATDDLEMLLDTDLYSQLTGGRGRHKLKPPLIRLVKTPDNISEDELRAIEALKPKWRRCYSRSSRMNPNLQGRVPVQFEVRASGVLSDLQSAGPDLPDSNAVNCVLAAFTSLSLPSAAGKGPLVITISFAPGG